MDFSCNQKTGRFFRRIMSFGYTKGKFRFFYFHKKRILLIIQRNIFHGVKSNLTSLFETYSVMINKYFLGKIFWIPLDMDIIIIYQHMEKPQIDELKSWISELFREFFIENASVVFMSLEEREKRYRLADKFVLQVMRYFPDLK